MNTEKINGWRNNHIVRISVIVILMLILIILYFRNVDTNNLNSIDSAKGEFQAQIKPDTLEKKVFLGLFAVMSAALGMEVSKTDIDLSTFTKVLRDREGNVVTQEQIDKGEVKKENAKYTDEYNCDDFKTQEEAQKFYDNAGGVNKDTNRLDGDKNGVACQALPKAKK